MAAALAILLAQAGTSLSSAPAATTSPSAEGPTPMMAENTNLPAVSPPHIPAITNVPYTNLPPITNFARTNLPAMTNPPPLSPPPNP